MTAPPESAVVLRPMRWWDVGRLLPAESELFGPTAWSEATFWSELAHRETRRYVVAEDAAGELLGYAGLLLPGSEADVQTIAVRPGAQRRGVGKALLAGLIRYAAEGGATSLLLEVRADNAPAIALYTRTGFERIAIRRRYYQPGDHDAHVMRLRPVRSAASQG